MLDAFGGDATATSGTEIDGEALTELVGIAGGDGGSADISTWAYSIEKNEWRKLEFGSPKVPLFPEALLLHYLDDLCSKVNNFLSIMEKEKVTPGGWSSYQRMYERPFYFGQAPEYDGTGEG